MTPDMGYFIERFDLSRFAHTFAGSFLACVPTGVLMMLFLCFFGKPLCYTFPSPHRQALLPLCPSFPTRLSTWLVILFSLLLGAWTHIFWDAFTHDDGWFVERMSFLQKSAFQTGSSTTHVYLLLQEVSTIVGFLIIATVYCRWLLRQGPSGTPSFMSEFWRYLFWGVIAVISLGFAVPAAIHYANSTSLRDFLFGRSIAFRIAIVAPRLGLPLALIGSTIIYARRPLPHLSAPVCEEIESPVKL
jgi:hypothetical protein